MHSLYDYQKQAVRDLSDTSNNKHIVIQGTGTGKSAVMMRWLLNTNKPRVLIVTTATKAKSGDFLEDADEWNGAEWRASKESVEIISWHGLGKWLLANKKELQKHKDKYAIAFDEVQKAKAYSSTMSRAFMSITASVDTWTGYTATPGDRWIDLMPYMVASGLIRNKTQFMNKYARISTYYGYIEILGYNHEDELQRMWDSITTRPDTSQMERELPPETHNVVTFKKTAEYTKALKTYIDPRTGEMVDSNMALCHLARQLSFTKEKQAWIADFIEGLGTNCVFFCNYIEEEETLCKIAEKALPKGARIWRIDGSHHEIPRPDTIGKYDIVVAHYASGGEALNLQFMNYWVSVSPNYSLSKSIQARGRIKRIGQKHSRMFFYYLKTLGTIEEDIYAALAQKKDFSELTWTALHGMAETD